MDTVIPAAGRSSRLGELTADRPKGLVEIAGQFLLAHVFETAVDGGGRRGNRDCRVRGRSDR
jgi:glucose-1-phosphate thymidylyltransferase